MSKLGTVPVPNDVRVALARWVADLTPPTDGARLLVGYFDDSKGRTWAIYSAPMSVQPEVEES